MSEIKKDLLPLEPGERERPTLKTIARLSGLAVPTVSRALSDAPDIGSDTKKRVRALAAELGYRRNRAGLRLRTGKTNVIALVISADRDVMNHTARLITSIAGELRGTPYHMNVTPYFPDQSPMDPIRYIVETGSADGIILNQIQPEDPRIAYMEKHRFPYAMHGRTEDCSNKPYFDFDNEAFGRQCVELLTARGRRHIALVAPPQSQNYARHMIAGATAAAADLGARIVILDDATSDSPSPDVTEAVLESLNDLPDIDGFIAASTPSAVATTVAIETTGRVLGRDVDLISKEAIPFLAAFRKEILVVHEDVSQAGAFLARAIMQAVDHPELPPMQKLVRPT
jgi:LacI family transcriptional regulator, galactose operon repressor